MKFLPLFVVLSVLSLTLAFKYDFERDLLNEDDKFVEKKEASDFLKRTLFHPGKTKNEEIKRETREVYEEKCETVVPFGKRLV